MGPKVAPLRATEKKDEKGKWCYRILRKHEKPWELRDPLDYTALSQQKLRALVLTAVAFGNEDKWTSQFLHGTCALSTVLRIFGERRKLYSHWLVRWPRFCTSGDKPAMMIDFETNVDKKKWLSEHDNDSALLEEAVKIARSYVQKDKEVVYLQRPDEHLIQVWDEESLLWRPVAHYKPEHAAKSQQRSDLGVRPKRKDTCFTWHCTMLRQASDANPFSSLVRHAHSKILMFL